MKYLYIKRSCFSISQITNAIRSYRLHFKSVKICNDFEQVELKRETKMELARYNGKDAIIPFSEALEKTGFGKFNYFVIFIGGVALTNVLLEVGSIGYILPIAECDLQLTNADKGFVSAIGLVGIIVSSHLWGFLADTKGRQAVMMPTLLISFAATLLSSFSYNFWIFLVLRFVNGFFISASAATMYAYVSEFHIDRIRSRAVVTSTFIFTILGMMIPFFAWCVINQSWSLPIPSLGITYRPWRLLVVILGIPGFLCGLALIFFPESPKFLLTIGKDKEAIEVLTKIRNWNMGKQDNFKINGIIPDGDIITRALDKSNDETFAGYLRSMWQQTIPIFQGDYLRSTLIIGTIEILCFAAIHGMEVWFPSVINTVLEYTDNNPGNKTFICDMVYARQTQVYTTNSAKHCTYELEEYTYMYSEVMEVLCTAQFFIILLIINKLEKVHILIASLVGCGACGFIIVFVQDYRVALFLYALLLVTVNTNHLLSGIIVELYPTHLRAMALCITLLCSRLGSMIGTIFIGLLLADNCEVMFYLSGIDLILCGSLAYFIPRKIKLKDGDGVDPGKL